MKNVREIITGSSNTSLEFKSLSKTRFITLDNNTGTFIMELGLHDPTVETIVKDPEAHPELLPKTQEEFNQQVAERANAAWDLAVNNANRIAHLTTGHIRLEATGVPFYLPEDESHAKLYEFISDFVTDATVISADDGASTVTLHSDVMYGIDSSMIVKTHSNRDKLIHSKVYNAADDSEITTLYRNTPVEGGNNRIHHILNPMLLLDNSVVTFPVSIYAKVWATRDDGFTPDDDVEILFAASRIFTL